MIEFLRIPSISALPEHSPDIKAAADFLVNDLNKAGLKNAGLIEGLGNLLVTAEWRGAEGRPTLLIHGHYDVQPTDPLDEWHSPPFEPQIRGDDLFARGAADDKGQVYLLIKAVEGLLKTTGKLPVNVTFLIEGEEECGGQAVTTYLERHGAELAADAVLICDTEMFAPGLPTLCVGLRGIVYAEIEVTGAATDLHSGVYGGAAPNALEAAAQIIAGLKQGGMGEAAGRVLIPGFHDQVDPPAPAELAAWAKLPFDEERYRREEVGSAALTGEAGYSVLERTWARPTLDIDGIRGGFVGEGAKTVIPARATVKVSMRLVPSMDPHDILAKFERRVNQLTPPGIRAETRRLHAAPASVVDPENQFVRTAANALSETFESETVLGTARMGIPHRALKASLLAASVLTLSALPVIHPAGVVNGASFLPSPLPGSALAPGSVVSIFGTNLGPAPGLAAAGRPLPTELANISVLLWNGEQLSRPARLLYAGPRQINAVLPTDLPAGLHFVIVRVGEETSPPEPVKVVASSFGIFTRRLTDPETGLVGRLPVVALVGNLTPEGRTVINSPWTPARLGGTIELWGTGLGRTADRPEIPATEHGDIEIDIGGRPFAIESAQAASCCLGVDRIRLRVPDQAPLGCFVPLSVRLRGVVYSNVETISISEDGSPCEDVPPIDRRAAPRRDGLVTLSRSVINGETFDEAEARFGPASATFSRLPAPGTCLPGLPEANPEVSATLDAGSELSLSTPTGAILLLAAPASEPPRYSVTSPPALLFLGPGEYTLVGGGGSDAGAFSASTSIPSAPIWAAPSGSEIVRRSRGFDVAWGAAEGSGILLTLTGGWGLTCRGAGEAGLLRLPAAILTNLPASARLPRGGERLEFVATFAPRQARFTAEGIDQGRLRAVHREARDVVLSPLELSSTPVTFPNGKVIEAELATAFSERQRGLMGRPELAADRGMLFLFERPGRLPFWMSGVLIPLDLVWLGTDRRIVGLSERTLICESASTCPLFDGGAEARFVLELAAGTAEANGLAVGDAVNW